MSPEQIGRRLEELRVAGEALRRRPAAQTLRALESLLDIWRDPSSAVRQELEARLPQATGFTTATHRELGARILRRGGDEDRAARGNVARRDADSVFRRHSQGFRRRQTAADAAQPGDTVHVLPGVYAPFQLFTGGFENNPITFSGPGDGTAVVDGGNTDRGVVTLGEYDRTLGHVIVSGLTIRNGAWGIDAQHTHDLFVHHNIIEDVDFGIYNRRGDAQEYNQNPPSPSK